MPGTLEMDIMEMELLLLTFIPLLVCHCHFILTKTGTFTVKINTTDNWGNRSSAQAVITVQPQTAMTPAVSPETSEQYEDWQVSMSTVQAAGTIRYTLDGSDPIPTSTIYTAPFNLTHVRYFSFFDTPSSSPP